MDNNREKYFLEANVEKFPVLCVVNLINNHHKIHVVKG